MPLPQHEKRIGFGAAARLAEVNPSTVYRWARFGLDAGERVVHLEYEKRGRKLRTTYQALSRFYAKLTDAHRDGPADNRINNNFAHADADAELAAEGI